jgi:hypothetical protein
MPEKSQNKGPRQDESPGGGREGKKSTRGFAAMDPQRQRDIASEGGRAAHEQGKAHKFTPEEAREAGRKGGMASGAARASRSKARAAQSGDNPGGAPGHGTGAPGAGGNEQKAGRGEEAERHIEDENRM